MVRLTTTLKRWINNLGIGLSKEVLNEVLFDENQCDELIADKTDTKIQEKGKIETLDDLFVGYDGNYEFHEITNTNVENEVW